MNLNDNKFFNSTDIHVSSRMNEYLKKNFGYAVDGDFETLEEAKKSLQAEQVELKTHQYMSQKYVENMLMIETITSLLKAHGEDTSSSYKHEEVTEESDATEEVKLPEAKPASAEHHRYKNDSQLARSKGHLLDTLETLEMAIEYRSQNSHLMMRGGDKAGTGDLYNMHDKLKDVLDNWDENTEYYGM